MIKEEEINALAYLIWEREGRPEGKDVEHHLSARKILEEDEAASASPKVSLPPSSSLVQPPSVSKPIQRRTGKHRTKKA
jgi:hypothetical protein